MSDEYDLDVTEITLPDELDTGEIMAIDPAVEAKRGLVFEGLKQEGFTLGRTFIFGNMSASGARGQFAEDWAKLMQVLPHSSVESLGKMFRVNLYLDVNSKTIVVNPEANKGADTSIWGVLSMVEHAALHDLAIKLIPSETLSRINSNPEVYVDPVQILVKENYKILNLLDLEYVNFEGSSISVPENEIERFIAASTMSRIYSNTTVLAPTLELVEGLSSFYAERGIRNITVHGNKSDWINSLIKK